MATNSKISIRVASQSSHVRVTCGTIIYAYMCVCVCVFHILYGV